MNVDPAPTLIKPALPPGFKLFLGKPRNQRRLDDVDRIGIEEIACERAACMFVGLESNEFREPV